MNRAVLAISVILILCSCGASRHTPVVEYRDSIRVEYRDRVIVDTAYYEVVREIEKNVTRDTASHLENTYAKSDAVVRDGVLYHSLESKPQRIPVPHFIIVRDTVIVEKISEQGTVTEYIEKELTWWQRFRLDGFWVLLAALIITNYKTILKWLV